MIKYALIAPRGLQQFTKLGDMHFIIPGYSALKWYATQEKFKMLDNGAWEYGQAVDDEKIMYWAMQTKASEIVLPDKLYDQEYTMRRHRAFIDKYPKDSHGMQLAMVPQGRDPIDWVKNYIKMVKMFPEVDTICVPKWIEDSYPGERLAILRHLKCSGKLDPRPHHLFGMRVLKEVTEIDIHNIRSIDTAKPISYGYYVTRLPFDKKLDIKRPSRDSRVIDTIREMMIIRNVVALKKACRGEDLTGFI